MVDILQIIRTGYSRVADSPPYRRIDYSACWRFLARPICVGLLCRGSAFPILLDATPNW